MLAPTAISGRREPWNKGKLVGQKAPLKLRDIWAIRVRLEIGDRKRELALFNLALDSKLRGRDLVQLRVRDVAHGDRIAARAIVMQQKTQRPVQFEITEPTRKSVFAWIRHAALKTEDYLFPSRLRLSPHLSTRQYARIVEAWVTRRTAGSLSRATKGSVACGSPIRVSASTTWIRTFGSESVRAMTSGGTARKSLMLPSISATAARMTGLGLLRAAISDWTAGDVPIERRADSTRLMSALVLGR
jgi:integrase-like protein